jgi:MEMO1 family protein
MLLLVTFCFIISVFLFFRQTVVTKPVQKSRPLVSGVTHFSRQDDPEFYNQAYKIDKTYTKSAVGHIRGGILPHHLLAGQLIAGFFSGISKQTVTTIILIGPNNYDHGP